MDRGRSLRCVKDTFSKVVFIGKNVPEDIRGFLYSCFLSIQLCVGLREREEIKRFINKPLKE